MCLPKLIRVMVCSAFLFGFARVQPAEAIAIEYNVIDLADMTVGDDLWQYEYLVSGFDFLTDQGFSVYFSPFLYSDLSDAGVEAPASADWDILTLVPDPGVPANGAFDALALIDHASLAKVFSITFVWLGAGTPGSQAFDVNQFDATGALIATLDSGVSAPIGVPEPAALLILGTGLASICIRHLRRRRWSGAPRRISF